MQVKHLTFHYPEKTLFDNWSVQIPTGITLVHGGEGCGKSSLLKVLAGVLPAQGGQLEINSWCLHEHADMYRQQVFWADPFAGDVDHFTVPEYFNSLRAAYRAFNDTVLAEVISGLSLTAHLEKQIYMLSTGSKRKLWLAAAFAAGATVTLLDDPFAGLDKLSIQYAIGKLNQLAATPGQAWVLALYEAPPGLAVSTWLDLGD